MKMRYLAAMMAGSAIGVAVGISASMAVKTPQVRKMYNRGRRRIMRYVKSL